ncbi:MAG TPA: ATP-binding protein [Candidatus Obscuribacterales bacterium]
MKLNIGHKGLIFAAVPLILSLFLLLNLLNMLGESVRETERQHKAREILKRHGELMLSFDRALLALGGLSVTGTHFDSDRYAQAVKGIQTDLEEFKRLVVDSQERQAQFAEIEKIANDGLSELAEAKSAIDRQEAAAIDKLRGLLQQTKENVEHALQKLIEDEVKVDQNSALRNSQSSEQLRQWVFLGILLNVILAAATVLFFSRGITNRLKVMTDNSLRLATGRPLNAQLNGDDEIAEMDRVFHRMAAELAEAARKERAMIENAVDVICTITEEGKFLEVSPASKTVWGYAPEELIGQRCITLVSEAEKESTLESINAAMASKQPFTMENRLMRPDGTAVDLSWSGCWSDRDEALFCVARDVTERKKVEQLKRDFVAMISHDLRTPLSSVQIYLEMVSEGFFDSKLDELRRKAKFSEADVSRLINLINNLLDIEKMEAGKMEISTKPIDADEIVARSINSVQSLAERKNIELRYEEFHTTVMADEEQLVQVLVNLLSNAIKFTEATHFIDVKIVNHEDCAEFQVIDQGRGISPEFKDKIFDRFQQVELQDAREKGGSGLGLAICKAIVVAHGGEIGVESELNKGSKFWFRIPLHKEHVAMPSKTLEKI